MPIVVDARVWGGLYATRFAGQPRFTAADVEFAAAVATQVAAGVVQADHFARIERLAFQDPLTGLANRRAVDDRLEAEVRPGAPPDQPVSVVLADINRLKQVNDSFGHEAGDRLIAAVGEAVSRASGLVAGSLAARIGGDEFCIVVERRAEQRRSPGGRGAVPAGRRAADEHRGVLRRGLDRLVGRARATRRCGCSGWPTPRSTAPSGPGCAGRSSRAGSRPGRTSTPPANDRRSRRSHGGGARCPRPSTPGSRCWTGSTEPGRETRLEAVADHLVLLARRGRLVGVARRPAAGRAGQVSSSVQRAGEHRRTPGIAQHSQVGSGVRAAPPSRPPSAPSCGAASFAVELGVPGNDPDEEAALVIAGYRAVHRRRGDGGRLRLAGRGLRRHRSPCRSLDFEPVLRALVAVAVAGGVDRRSSGAGVGRGCRRRGRPSRAAAAPTSR